MYVWCGKGKTKMLATNDAKERVGIYELFCCGSDVEGSGG